MKKIVFILSLAFISILSIRAQAPGAACTGAVALTVGGACGSGNVNDATQGEAGINTTDVCLSGQGSSRDGWYKFVATSTNATITGNNSNRNLTLQVYSGGCASLTEIACANNTTTAGSSTETANAGCLTVGTTYYVRVSNVTSNTLTLTSLCITAGSSVSNDDPCSATAITSGASCSYTNSTNVNAGSSSCVAAPGCASYQGGDVWFTTTIPASGSLIVDTQTGGMTDGGMAIYTGTCSSLTQVGCDDDSSPNGAMPQLSITGTPGATVWIRIWGYNGSTGTFGICAYDAGTTAVPAQNCNGAIPVCNDNSFAGNSAGYGTQELNGSNEGCLTGAEHQTTWFGFSPVATGTIQLTISPTAGSVDYDFAIWGPYPTPGCPVTGSPLRCSFSAVLGPTGLSSSAADVTEGAGGDSFVSPITVAAGQVGQVYYLVVDNYTANTTPFTLDWTFSTPNMLNCTPPLPVEMGVFNAEPKDKFNRVFWTTETEINNSHFIVEKSSDGVNYNQLVRVEGNGNSNIPISYQQMDNEPSATTYYKLKQVDYNGDYKYYGPVVIQNESLTDFSFVNMFPNPADEGFFIDLYSKDALEADVFIYNSFGQSVYSKVVQVQGSTRFEIASDTWAPGIYIVKVVNDTQHFQHIERLIVK